MRAGDWTGFPKGELQTRSQADRELCARRVELRTKRSLLLALGKSEKRTQKGSQGTMPVFLVPKAVLSLLLLATNPLQTQLNGINLEIKLASFRDS